MTGSDRGNKPGPYDEANLDKAIQAYRSFYPSGSIAGAFAGFEKVGGIYNKSFLEGRSSGATVVGPLLTERWGGRGVRRCDRTLLPAGTRDRVVPFPSNDSGKKIRRHINEEVTS
jgi:hypothetical protein